VQPRLNGAPLSSVRADDGSHVLAPTGQPWLDYGSSSRKAHDVWVDPFSACVGLQEGRHLSRSPIPL
jgi:hypothetical protein